MSPTRSLKILQILGPTAALLALFVSPATTQQAPPNQNWRTYGGDITNTRYSPLTQIDAGNFSKLQVAWTFSTANLGPAPETNLESTPLVIDGVLYSTAGDRRDVVALDAATGDVLKEIGEKAGIEFQMQNSRAPANGAKIVNGTRRKMSMRVVGSGSALATTRTNPSAARKLNQLPSSEITWPIQSRMNERFSLSSCV